MCTVDSRRCSTRTRTHVRRHLAAGFLFVLLFPAWLLGQAVSTELQDMEVQLEEARQLAVHLIAPRTFERAVDRFEDATSRFQRGQDRANVEGRLNEARALLADANLIAERAREMFSAALKKREDAVVLGVEAQPSEFWRRAEDELQSGGQLFEREEIVEARIRAASAAELYDQAIKSGWREQLLGAAIRARQVAISVRANELAPDTFTEAEQQLAMGEADVLSGRTGDAPARAGQAALEAFLRSVEIAALADSVGRRAINVETLVLAHEDDLASLAAAAGFEAQGGKTEQTAEKISSEIRRLQSEVERLTVELSSTSEAASQLSNSVTILEGRLTESEANFTNVRNELLDRQQREDRLREAQGLFLPSEGEVFLAGNRFVLRLFGLTFESGSSEILEEHHSLLMKVQRVITTFEGASVRIEGHTDAQGGEEGNQRLSQRRAIAVREHLLARIPIPSSRVEALGLGEAQPIGSNETEEGRARNRRIEVVITLLGG